MSGIRLHSLPAVPSVETLCFRGWTMCIIIFQAPSIAITPEACKKAAYQQSLVMHCLQALEALAKLKKEKAQQAKELRLKLDHLRTHRDAAQKLRAEVSQGTARDTEHMQKIQDFEDQMQVEPHDGTFAAGVGAGAGAVLRICSSKQITRDENISQAGAFCHAVYQNLVDHLFCRLLVAFTEIGCAHAREGTWILSSQ